MGVRVRVRVKVRVRVGWERVRGLCTRKEFKKEKP